MSGRGGPTLLTLAVALLPAACLEPGDAPFDPVDTVPPTVALALPVDGAEGVPADVVLELFFSEPVQRESLEGRVHLASGVQVVPGRLVYRAGVDDHVSFEPRTSLLPGALYTLTVSPDVRDRYHLPMDEPFVSTFVPTDTPPTFEVVAVEPPDGAADVPVDAPLRLVLSRPVPARFATPEWFVLRGPEGTPVAIDVEVEADPAAEIGLRPRDSLDGSSSYTIEVSAELLNVAAQRLGAPFESAFHTAPSP